MSSVLGHRSAGISVIALALLLVLCTLALRQTGVRPGASGSDRPLDSLTSGPGPQTLSIPAVQPNQYTPVSVGLSRGPEGVAFDGENSNLYVGLASGAVSVVNSTNDSVTTPVLGYASQWENAEVYDAPTHFMYLAGGIYGSNVSSDVSVIEAINSSTNRVAEVQNLSLEGPPPGGNLDCLAAAGANGTIFACDSSDSQVDVFNGSTDRLVGTIPVGIAPAAAVNDPASGDVYVANWGSANLSVVQVATERVVGSIPVGSGPLSIALDTSNGYLYVANKISDNVTVVDPATGHTVTSIAAGCQPQAIAYDPANQGIFVANTCGDNVTEFSGVNDTFVQDLPVGGGPDAIAYDPANQGLYVANYFSLNLTALFLHEYPVDFTEHGLPAGTSWSVQVGEWTRAGSGPSISINEPNGSFYYGVTPAGAYWPAPLGGQFLVTGSGLSFSILFALSVVLNFTVNGIPDHQEWRVNVSNASIDFAEWEFGLGDSASFHVIVNETYAYSVTFSGSYGAWNKSGVVAVGDQNVSLSITVGNGSPPAQSSAWPWDLTVVLVAIAVSAALAVVALRRRHRGTPPAPPGAE